MNKELRQFDNTTDRLAEVFLEKYFGEDVSDVYWVGDDDDKEILSVNDHFFSLDRIVTALRYEATKKQLFDYYNMELEDEKPKMNFRNFIKYVNNKK